MDGVRRYDITVRTSQIRQFMVRHEFNFLGRHLPSRALGVQVELCLFTAVRRGAVCILHIYLHPYYCTASVLKINYLVFIPCFWTTRNKEHVLLA
jgi:hypothetical protein